MSSGLTDGSANGCILFNVFIRVRSVIRGAIPKFADLRELHRLTYVDDGIKIEVI